LHTLKGLALPGPPGWAERRVIECVVRWRGGRKEARHRADMGDQYGWRGLAAARVAVVGRAAGSAAGKRKRFTLRHS
jgi:hypothetical protein